MNVHRNVYGRLMPGIPKVPDRILRKWLAEARDRLSLRLFGYQDLTGHEHVDFHRQRMTLVR